MITAFRQKLDASPVLKALVALLSLLTADALFLAISSSFYPLILPAHLTFKIFLLNLLPIVLVSLLWFLLTARTLVSFILTATFFDAVFLANKMKMANLGVPSIIVDYVSAFSMMGHSDLLAHYFTSWWHPGILLVLLVVAIALMFFEKPAFKLKLIWRPTLLAIAVFLLLQTGPAAIRQIYNPGSNWRAWQTVNNLHEFGLLYILTRGTALLASSKPDFDKDRVAEILKQQADRLVEPQNDLPDVRNIIVILSESFFDPSDLNGVDKGRYDLPGYIELKSHSLRGRITVPAYAGATLRTEFELLTGVGLDLFPAHSYPLISLVMSPMNSIAWDARRAGYSTLGIHPNRASFWSRDTAYPYLGFEKFLDIEDFGNAQRSGYYVADTELTGMLKREINDDVKQFVFAISMENHGPWKAGRPNLDEEKLGQIETPDKLRDESLLAFRQYIYHRQAAQAALLDLIEDLDERKASLNTRSVVLFFGDHLPGLEQPFEDLEFKNGLSPYLQSTPYLIYDTHQDLSVLNTVRDDIIDVTLLGSLLMDVSLKDLPAFHPLAEKLQSTNPERTNQETGAGLTDLQELQLWRFWQRPLDSHGVAFEATARSLEDLKKAVKRDPLDCQILQWGPRKTYVGEGFNVQPNGQSALYVRTDCIDRQLDIRIDGKSMWTTKDGDVLSTMMPADDLVAETGKHTVELYERTTGRSQTLGVFKVKRRWWPE